MSHNMDTDDLHLLRIGTRSSPLAIRQAKIAIKALSQVATQNMVIVPVSQKNITKEKLHHTVNSSLSFSQKIQKARFVTYLEDALLNQDIDIAVHSLKDLSTKTREELLTDCYLPREIPNDTFVNKRYTIENLPSGSHIGTSSPRRTAQIKAFRSDITPVPLQGNVETRLSWCDQDPQRSIILAEAGLIRLQKKTVIRHNLPLDAFLPAGGQGIITLQCRTVDNHIGAMLKHITDRNTFLCATVERDFLFNIGASCLSPVGVLASIEQNRLLVRCAVWQPDGKDQWQQEHGFSLEEKSQKYNMGKMLADLFLKNVPTKILDSASLDITQ